MSCNIWERFETRETNVIVGNVPELGVLPRYGFGGATARPVCLPWNNGKEVAEIQKMSPSTIGRCYQTREWGQPTNGSAARRHGSQSHGLIIFDVQAWSEKLY